MPSLEAGNPSFQGRPSKEEGLSFSLFVEDDVFYFEVDFLDTFDQAKLEGEFGASGKSLREVEAHVGVFGAGDQGLDLADGSVVKDLDIAAIAVDHIIELNDIVFSGFARRNGSEVDLTPEG